MTCFRRICLAALVTLGGYAVQAEVNQETLSADGRHRTYRDAKTRSSILPLGEALVFAGIGTVSVVWMRKRRVL